MRSLAGALALALAACGRATPPDVLLIVVDTLRADRVGAGDHGPTLTPAIDALAARGVRLEAAYATSSWTRPSLASIFTARLPSSHGVQEPRQPLPASARTLAEAFADRGYATHAVVSNPILRAKWGFGQGFDVWDDELASGPEAITSSAVADRVIAALDGGGGPRLVFALFFDPHWRYQRHDSAEPLPTGRLRGDERTQTLSAGAWTAEERAFVAALYDGEVRAVDAAIGRILEHLERGGRSARTVVVVTADHGECLGERGYFGHVENLDEELVRVPLIAAGPGIAAGANSSALLSQVGLAPTLLELCGLPAEATFAGASFADALRAPERAAPGGAVCFEVDYLPTPHRSNARTKLAGIRRGPWKLVVDELSGERTLSCLGPGAEVAPAARAALQSELERELAARRGHVATPVPPPLEDADLEDLRALGYAEGEVSSARPR